MGGRAMQPPQLATEFWLRPDVGEALRGRDFGALFRLVSKYAGASQTQIAIAVGMSQGQVSSIMGGGRRVTAIDVSERVLDGLQASDEARVAFGLAPRAPEITVAASSPTVPRPRNAMIDGLGGYECTEPRTSAEIPSGAAGDEDVSDVLQRMHRRTRSVDPGIVDLLSSNVRDIVTRYEELDPADYIPIVRKQRVWLETLIDDCGQPRRRMQLSAAACTASGLLGYVALGGGKFRLAQAYCAEAFQLGEFAEDAGLQAWARGLQSFCAYYGQDYAAALDLAMDGLRRAGSGPQSVRLAINGAARALGKLGDIEGVHRLVGRAYSLLPVNDTPTGIPSSIGFGSYSPSQIASNAATAYLSLGLPDKARQYVDLALPDINRHGSSWSRALVRIDLATALAQSKDADLDHATSLIEDAVNMTRDQPIISVRQRAMEFTQRARQRWGETVQVAAIRDLVATVRWTGV